MSKLSPWKHFELAYVTIELESAFIVGAADSDNLFDAVFVTDANGLPTIPGESLAGVVRHALSVTGNPETDEVCKEVFGFQEGSDGAASRVRFSFAHVHDESDRPVPFRGAKTQDKVLSTLQAGVGRDHVRIGKHGTAEHQGKFDQLIIPAGARFTFEIALSRESGKSITDLLEILARPEVRIGGKTRSGLGRFKVVRAASAEFDLSKREDLKRLGKLRVALEKAVHSDLLKALRIPQARGDKKSLHGTLKLKPIGTWMIGGGMPTGREPERGREGPWDRVPLSETKIVWTQGKQGEYGKVLEEKNAPYLLPASSVKGALRHRTSFHARRLSGRWFGECEHQNFTAEEELLFGAVRGKDAGEPGRVYLSDIYLDPNTPLQSLQHVSLDRFTQGPMDHLLYDELVLGQCELAIDVTIDDSYLEGQDGERAKQALQAALDDLCQGRLALGAGRGHGRFTGTIEWRDNKALVKQEVASC